MPSLDRMSAVPSPRSYGGLALAQGQGSPGHYAQENQRNLQFVELLNAFRRSGGLARVPEVAARFRMYDPKDVSPLAGWINNRQVISFEWQAKRWLPLFQFNPVGLSLRAGLQDVLTELLGVCDDWEVSAWFARPNPWLAERAPADMLAVAVPQVLNAARAERFVVTG
jgi:hypothetical protein